VSSNAVSRGRRKFLRPTVLLVAVLASLTCNDSPFEPGMEVSASFDVQQLLEAAQNASIPIDSLVIELRRVSDSSIAHTVTVLADSVTISPDGNSVSVEIRIPMESRTEQFYLSLAVIGDGIVWLQVTDVITVEAGSEPTTTSELIPAFVGPGANATDIVLSLSDTTITGGDSLLILSTVYEGDTVADSALVSFYSSDSSKVATPIAAGYGSAWVHAPAALTDTVAIFAEVQTAEEDLRTSGVLRFFARPQTLRAVSGENQNMLVGETAVQPLVVQVIDAAGNPFSRGFPVEFAVTAGPTNTSVDQSSVSTDAEGYASTQLTAGETIGEIQVSATAAGLSGSPITFTATVVPGAAATMVANAGSGQTAAVGTAVSTPPSVLVTDDNDDPVPDVIVTFSVTSGGGSVTGAVDTTDATGVATVGSWTLGTSAGVNELAAASPGLSPVTFTATGTTGAASAVITISGDGQSGAGGAPLAQPLVVAVADQYENPIEGIQVSWATAFGSVDPASSQTDADGLAQTSWTLDPDSASQTATATVTGLDPATFTATLSVGAQNIEIADGNNQTATVGATLPVSPSVYVTDGGGNPAPDEEVTFEVVSGGGSVVQPVVMTDSEGIAQVGGWTLGQTVGTNTLTATVAGVTPVTFTASGTADVADTVVIVSGQAQTADAGTDLPLPLVVEVQDQYGNPVSGETVDWQALNGSVTPTTGTTDGSGRAQTTWTLGLNSTSQTASASVGTLAPAVFSATATFPTPTILLALLGTDRVSVGSTADLEVTLTAPAGVGGATVTVTSDNPSVVGVQPPEIVTIAEGNTTGQVVLEGVAGGFATVRANATGYIEGTLVVESSLQVLSLPTTVNVPFGGTASLPLTISTPAPAGGETVTLISSNPASVALQASTVTIPEGSYTINATVLGVSPGTSTVTATSATHGSAQSIVSTTANLNIVESSLGINESFGGTITIQLESGGSPIAAPAGGITVTLTPADPTCVSATSPVTISAGFVDVTSAVTYGGSATTSCNTTVTASATDITSDNVSITVSPVPGISMPTGISATTASGLQRSQTGYLGASNHGGVDVVITSSDPSVLLVSPDASTAGTESITVHLAAGYTTISYYIHGIEDAIGTPTVTATAPLFSDGASTSEVVQPAFEIAGLATSTTSLTNDDPFYVNVGVPYTANSSVQYSLAVRAGAPGPLTVTLTSSNPAVGQLTTTPLTGGTVTVEIPELQYRSPTSVANGGAAFDPIDAGTTTVSASIPGFIATTAGSQEVTVTAPGITLYTTTTASGLQRSRSGSLNATNHGGVDVVVTSSNPAVMLLSPNSTTPGTASVTLPVADGSSGFTYYVQGVEDATGTVDITANATGFTEATVTSDVVAPGVQIAYLATSTTTLSPDDPFYAQVGIPYSGNTSLQTTLQVRAGAPAPLNVTVVSSNPSVGQLTTTPDTGETVTVEIAEGQYNSPSTVANGGVAFEPLTAGTTTVSASIPGYTPMTQASVDVTVTAPGINVPSTPTASGLQRSVSGSLAAPDHGGVDVVLTSSDPAVLLLSPNASTAGTTSITIPVNDGSTSFSYYVQGVESATGTATITATANGFTDGSNTVNVVQPGVEIQYLATSTTSLSDDDPFYAQVGIPYSGNSYLQYTLAVRAGAPGPLTVTVTSSAQTVGQLVTTDLQAGTVTVEIPEGTFRSPTTVATGGVAFDPLTAGTTTVSATIPGYIQTNYALREVTVTAPSITLYETITGSGLQRSRSALLGAGNHGGLNVTITSSNPSVLLLSPNATTAGSESIVVPVSDGNTSFSYYVHGIENQTGNILVTATAPGFIDGSATTEVVQPAVQIYQSSLTTPKNTLDPDDEFYAQVGLPYAGDTQLQTVLDVRFGAPSLTATFVSSTPTVGQLLTSSTSGASVTAEVVAGESNTPTTLAGGGVAFEPLDAGATTVSVSIPGFIVTDYAAREVTVTASGMTLYDAVVGAGLQLNNTGYLEGSDHGGVDVVITSSDPSVLLVSPDETTPGTASITVPVADGSTRFDYYVQGVEGQTGTTSVTVTATGFTNGTATKDVVQPALRLYSLYTTMTTDQSDDPFSVRVGIPDATQTSIEDYQEVRAGAPSSYTATVTSSDAGVGQLVTSTLSGGSVTVQIVVGDYYSPGSVADGGVAFDPIAVGTTTVTATIPGFVTLPAAGYGAIDVTVTTP